MNKLKEKIETSEIYSFDIFDTLITRKTLLPQGIFSIMAYHIKNDSRFVSLSEFVKNNFYQLRIQAEQHLRCVQWTPEHQDITFDDIYKVLAYNNNISEQHAEDLKDFEFKTEIKNLIPIEENIEKIRNLIAQNKTVILISDMYHTSQNIRTILCRIDPIFENLKIYVSSESNKCKHTGDFYDYIKEQENREYVNWFHIGDNYPVDIEKAREKGIDAQHYKYTKIMPFEYKLFDERPENAYAQLSCGASKNCRLFNNRDDKFEFGASYSGPLFFSYVTWLLEQSIKRGFKRLYFIARDGYILKEMADIIIKKCGYDIRTKYIYGSRDAWRLSSLIDDSSDFTKMFNCIDIDNFDKIAEIFHLEKDDLMKFVPNQYKNAKAPFSDSIREQIKDLLSSNKSFIQYILERSENERELMCGYLKQEIDFSDDNFAFVEFKGSGATQDALNKVINTFYKTTITTFFLSLDRDQFTQESYKLIFFPNTEYAHYSLESLLRAPHGQTIGYKYDGKKYIALFEENEIDYIKSWGFDSYLDGIKEYTAKFTQYLLDNMILLSHVSVYCSHFQYLMHSPNRKIANVFGSIPFSAGLRNKTISELAPKIRFSDIIKILFTGKIFTTSNMQISKRRSFKPYLELIRQVVKIRCLLGLETGEI